MKYNPSQEVSNRKRGKLHEEEFEDVSGRDSDWQGQ